MNNINGTIKRLTAMFLSVFIVLSLVISINVDVSANSSDLIPNIDVSNKTFTCYVRPYAGFKASEVASCFGDPAVVYPYPSNDKATISYSASGGSLLGLFDESGKRLSADDVLVKGKKYIYKAMFESKTSSSSSIKAYDIKDFKVKMINVVTGEEISCNVSGPVIYSDSFLLNVQYEFVASNPPTKDLGCLTIDLSDGKYNIPDKKTYHALYYCLQFLSLEDVICWEDSHKMDLNNDGIDDISLYDDSVNKLTTISVKGIEKYELPKPAKDFLNKEMNLSAGYFYNSVEFIFDKIDISKAAVTQIEDKDYTVSYSNNIEVGTATVTITGTGRYTGTTSKTFKINKVEEPEDEIPEITGTVHGDISSGLWVERSDGTYPVSQWGKVNGKTYYFDKRGYAAANEYADGKWFNADGTLDEAYSMEWKCNSTGWWIEDKSGWYPVSRWLKIDGYWYYFLDSGYMDYSEYRDGCYLGNSGAWIETMSGGHWCSDSKGWWYEDATGWYPTNLSLWIDGVKYSFGSDGYMK